ncbi:MAG: PKD domain-containing protein [Thermoplasmata archaeon]
MKKQETIVILISLVFLMLFCILFVSSHAHAGRTTGDWIITQDEIHANENITLTGNLTVNNSKLTLENSYLFINQSQSAQYLVNIDNGTLELKNSTIRSNYGYSLTMVNNSSLLVTDSNLLAINRLNASSTGLFSIDRSTLNATNAAVIAVSISISNNSNISSSNISLNATDITFIASKITGIGDNGSASERGKNVTVNIEGERANLSALSVLLKSGSGGAGSYGAGGGIGGNTNFTIKCNVIEMDNTEIVLNGGNGGNGGSGGKGVDGSAAAGGRGSNGGSGGNGGDAELTIEARQILKIINTSVNLTNGAGGSGGNGGAGGIGGWVWYYGVYRFPGGGGGDGSNGGNSGTCDIEISGIYGLFDATKIVANKGLSGSRGSGGGGGDGNPVGGNGNNGVAGTAKSGMIKVNLSECVLNNTILDCDGPSSGLLCISNSSMYISNSTLSGEGSNFTVRSPYFNSTNSTFAQPLDDFTGNDTGYLTNVIVPSINASEDAVVYVLRHLDINVLDYNSQSISNANVSIYRLEALVDNGFTNADGNISFILPGNITTKNGTITMNYTISITYKKEKYAKDVIMSGDEEESIKLACLKNTRPSVYFDTPLDKNAVYKEVTIHGRSEDLDGEVKKVEIKVDNGSWVDAGSTSSWNYIWNASITYRGEHAISARAFDDEDFSIETITVFVNETLLSKLVKVLSGSDKTVKVNRTVNFNSSTKEDFVYSLEWDFDDTGGTSYDWNSSMGTNAAHTYYRAGIYSATLRVTAINGINETAAIKVNVVANILPVARIDNRSVSGNVVKLSSSGSSDSDGEIVSYLWDFGDGNYSYEQSPTYIYAKKGNFTINLTVTDDDGESTTVGRNVTVKNFAPAPIITEPVKTSFKTLEVVNFNASKSVDTDSNLPLTYLWQFNDSSNLSNATTPTPSHVYGKAGTYNVTLTVTDAEGASNDKTVLINITNRAPKPLITIDGAAKENEAVVNSTLKLNASTSYDDDGNIAGYQWEIDGYVVPWNTTRLYNYTPSASKKYTVILRVRDDNNDTGETRITIDVGPRKPTLFIDYDKSVKYKPGEKIAFDASKSTPGDATIIAYKWEFGDSESTAWSLYNINQSHTYSHSGNYSIKFYAKDSSGTESNTTINITIENIPPIPVMSTPHRSGKVGETITFDASKSTDPYGKIVAYIWDFGDGTKETVDNPIVTHVYQEPWQYKVTLTLIDDNGTSSNITLDPALLILSETSKGGENSKWALDDPNVIGLVVSAIGLAIGYIAYTAKKRKLTKSIDDMTAIYVRYKNRPEYCESELNKFRENFLREFENGKLDGNNYLILEKKIENYVKELRTKTVKSKMGAIPIQIQQTIANILADGKVSKEEYDSLMNTINGSDISESQRKQLNDMLSIWMKSDDRFRHPVEIAAPQPQERAGIPKPTHAAQRVRCTKCSAIINVTSTKRPLMIYCPSCGMKGVLKSKEVQK